MEATSKALRNSLLSTLALAVSAIEVAADAVDVEHFVLASGNDPGTVTVVIERLSDGQTWVSNSERAELQLPPASTAKVPHTLIAIESGLVDATTVFTWDGVPRSSRAWNQDQTLETAFRTSAVWVYQEITNAVGQSTMLEGLLGFDYGNLNIGTSEQLNTYWLDGTLRISAAEQVEFLSRLAVRELALAETTFDLADDIMVSDEGDNWVMRSKTGWYHDDDVMDVGWHVGWLECLDETYVFALNMDMPDSRYLSRRTAITYLLLEEIGAFDCS